MRALDGPRLFNRLKGEIGWAVGRVGQRRYERLLRKDPSLHCFRENSASDACCDCGYPADAHEGCDCE